MRYLARCLKLSCLVVLAAAVAVMSGPARAADAAPPAGSLKWIPADAAFYTSMLRAGEQIELIAKSKAWARLKAMPSVQMLVQMAQAQMKNPSDPQAAMFLQILQQPENKQLIGMLNDMIAHEVFCYGGENATRFIELMTIVNGSQQMGNVMGAIQRAQGGDPSKVQAQAILRALNEHAELIQIPDMVIGFKLGKPDVATAQLKRLDDFLTQVLKQVPPPIAQRYKKGSGATMFTLTLDGSLIPWDKVSLKQFEDKEGEFDTLMEKLKKLTLTVSLGVRDDYLLISVGESTAFLSKLGNGSLLGDRPEFKPLQKHAGERLTGISYASKELRSHGGMTKRDIDSMAAEAKKYLEKSENIPPPVRERLTKDLGDLATDFKSFIHEQGAALSFSFLNGHGQESFSYDWSAHSSVDGSKPLTLLHHLGGSPLLGGVARSKYQPENYQMLVKWIKHLNGYVEDFVVPQLNEAQKGQYEQVMKIFQPLLERLDKATGTMLLPALKDGQTAFVLDAKLESKQWHQQMPASDKPLPLPEPALVLGVSDAELLKKALSEYRAILNEAISKLRDLQPAIPEFQIPEPETKSVPGGTIYYYPIPEALGLDKQISPNAGLSDHVAVLSISQAHSERLLKNTPLKANGPLADPNKPLAGAVVFDFAGFIGAVGPWIEYAIESQSGSLQEAAAANPAIPSKDDILKQVRTAIDILKCFRGYSGATYFEDKVLVTHGLAVFEDLP
jgi:hypothetical protein